MDAEEKKGWNLIQLFLWMIQFGAEFWLMFRIWKLNMLPGIFMGIVIFLMVFLLAVTFLGMSVYGIKRKGIFRKCIAALLSIVIIVVCVISSNIVGKVSQTVDKVTDPTTVSQVVGVYVRKDDPAHTLEDAADYIFAVTDSFDLYNSDQTVQKMKAELGKSLNIRNYPAVTDMVDALYMEEVGAIVMNEAYTDVLLDSESYMDFEDKTRLLYEYKIEVKNEESVSEKTEERPITERTFIVYLSGSDTRSEILRVSRSDVNILMVVNPVSKQILLLNTPRDYYVPNPIGNGALDKLTHCGIYGVENSMKTLSDLYGTQIDYYGQINFTGFEKLIDAIGGVTVYSEVDFTAADGSKIHKGDNHLSGSSALGFARERHNLSGGDNARGKNQMKVIKAIIDQISSGDMYLVTNYASVMSSLQGMFITNVSSEEISELVKMQLSDMAGWNVKSYAVTGEGGKHSTYSSPNNHTAYVMYPNTRTVNHASALIEKVKSGEMLSDADVQ